MAPAGAAAASARLSTAAVAPGGSQRFTHHVCTRRRTHLQIDLKPTTPLTCCCLFKHLLQAQDFTFATEGGLTSEEWVDGAADRAIKVG